MAENVDFEENIRTKYCRLIFLSPICFLHLIAFVCRPCEYVSIIAIYSPNGHWVRAADRANKPSKTVRGKKAKQFESNSTANVVYMARISFRLRSYLKKWSMLSLTGTFTATFIFRALAARRPSLPYHQTRAQTENDVKEYYDFVKWNVHTENWNICL